MFFCCPFDAMGATMATYGGQNVGAAKWERLHQGMRACVLLGAVYSVLSLGLLYFFACKGAPGAFHVDSRLMQLLPEYIQLPGALLHRLAGVREAMFHA